jgi:F0F1-type ATP synthase epsilon subunit
MKLFNLKMITPEKILFQGKAQSIRVMVEDGSLEI